MPPQNAVCLHPSFITLSTEACQGTLMVSAPGKPARFMQPVPGISYRFDPLTDTTTGAENPASTQLLKFILLADSPQIPQPQLLSDDGNFHTGDLFEKQLDGSYLFRGRADDWIKTNDADCIDTKYVVLNTLDLGMLNRIWFLFFSPPTGPLKKRYMICVAIW